MNQKQIAIEMSKSLPGVSVNDCNKLFTVAVEAIMEDVKQGNPTTIMGFGTFSPSFRKARAGRNPATGETIQIAECNSASFRVSKAFKELLN